MSRRRRAGDRAVDHRSSRQRHPSLEMALRPGRKIHVAPEQGQRLRLPPGRVRPTSRSKSRCCIRCFWRRSSEFSSPASPSACTSAAIRSSASRFAALSSPISARSAAPDLARSPSGPSGESSAPSRSAIEPKRSTSSPREAVILVEHRLAGSVECTSSRSAAAAACSASRFSAIGVTRRHSHGGKPPAAPTRAPGGTR